MKALLLATAVCLCWNGISPAATPALKTETFDRDPRWEGHNNRILPKNASTVTQDFGYSGTNHAGKAVGEVGGRIQRSTTPAYYAVEIPTRTLEDRFTASGSFALLKSEGSAGVFFGFFHSQQPGGSGRPIGSLGLDFDFEGSGGRLAVRLITNTNKSCGTFITPYLPGKFRPTPIKNDGTRYHWTLAYDPEAAGGTGQFAFTLRSESHTKQDYGALPEDSQEEALARFPNTTQFTVEVTPGLRKEGATFDRFGVLNMMKSGGGAVMYFDDVVMDGRSEDFSKEPGWIGSGNRTTYEDREIVGAHDFGFSAKTHHAGGAKDGEVGGGLWRSGDYGYYADRVGPFGLDHKLEARGKVKLVTAGPDSDMHIGWFNSAAKAKSPDEAGNFIGIHVGGPTRIGHYFIPQLATAKGGKGRVETGPIIVPGKSYDWSMVYDPSANNGNGAMRVTLGSESATLALRPGQRAQDAMLDRFGLFTSQSGGQMVKIFLDDLSYTAEGHPGSTVAPKPTTSTDPRLAPIVDRPGLPRVLLIGDSISKGYTLPVRKLLEETANVHRIPANGGPTTRGLQNLDAWLGEKKWDVIYFNFGLHDLEIGENGKCAVEPEAYEKNLRLLVGRLNTTGAKLIWATTTPIPDGDAAPARAFGNVVEYNLIAARVMTENGVTINDLHGAITPHSVKYRTPKSVHFEPGGYEVMARHAAASIETALKARSR